MKNRIILFVLILCFNQQNLMAQEEKTNQSVYQVFQTFFENEIKYQGVKGDWLFKLKHITGTHKFDFQHNNLEDVLIEFTAIPIDGRGLEQFYSVFFKQIVADEFKFTAFFESENLQFQYVEDGLFIFKNLTTNSTEKKKLNNNTFKNVSVN